MVTLSNTDQEYLLKNSKKLIVALQSIDEVEESLDLIKQVAEEGQYLMEDSVDQNRIEWTKKQMTMNGEEVLFIVAKADGKIVGNLDLVRYGRWSKTAHVRYLDMAVLDGFRSIGVGTALMEYSMNWAKAKGFEKIILEVFSTNERAINLYRKFGFIVEGINKSAVKILGDRVDIIQMGLFL